SVVEANSAENSVSEFASVSLRYKPGAEMALINGLIHILINDNLLAAERLASIPDFNEFKSSSTVAQSNPDRTTQQTGISADNLRRAARLLATEDVAIIAGETVSDHVNSDDLVTALANLAVLTGNGTNLNIPTTLNNQQGAMDM